MAKKRKVVPKKISKSGSNFGYYMFMDSGISVVYASNVNEDGSMDAALFGIDTWRDGIIACQCRHFENMGSFEEFMRDRHSSIKPSTKIICREEIAYGLRIRENAHADLPPEFDKWRHLVDPLGDVILPPYIYRCPECKGRLPEEYIEKIISGIDGNIIFYLLCDRCNENQSPLRKSARYATTIHVHLYEAIKDLEEFTVTWYQDYMPELIDVPVREDYKEGIKEMISMGDIELAATMAIEVHIAHSTVPNNTIKDHHVLAALKMVINDKLIEDDENPETDLIEYVAGYIQEGINMFSGLMRFKLGGRSYIDSALDKIAKSVVNHYSKSNPRSYIEFIHHFVKV